MSRERFKKVATMVVLLIVVVGLGLGFSAFSNTLTIAPTAEVNVNPASFKVGFSTSNSSLTGGSVTPTTTLAQNSASALRTVTASTATIDNSGSISTISNFQIKFTESGQSAQYRFYIYNAGEYTAYLNSVVFGNATGANTYKSCTPITGNDNVSSYCGDISVSIKIGNTTITDAQATNTLTGHSLSSHTAEEVIITIAYNSTFTKYTDFYATYGDITVSYSTVDSGRVPEYSPGGGGGGSTITNLAGTTWTLNNTLNFAPLTSAFSTINLDFTASNSSTSYEGINISGSSSGVYLSYEYDIQYEDGVAVWGEELPVYVASEGGWMINYQTITITGGSDATNPTLIAWLYANATQVQGITNLTGTTWQFNNVLTFSPLTSSANFSINFGGDYIGITISDDGNDGVFLHYADDSIQDYVPMYISEEGGWLSSGTHTITITGGSDATNATLIAWLQANATQIN